MTKSEIDEIEAAYLKHRNTKAGKKILALVEYTRLLEALVDNLVKNHNLSQADMDKAAKTALINNGGCMK